MKKRVEIGARPSGRGKQPASDQWVQNRHLDDPEPIQRLTIDLPASLHKQFKLDCVQRGVKMADEIRGLLSKKYRKK